MRKIQDHARQYLYQTALLRQCEAAADWESAGRYFAHEWTKGTGWRFFIVKNEKNNLIIRVLHPIGLPIAELAWGEKPVPPNNGGKAKKGKKAKEETLGIPLLWLGESEWAFRSAGGEWAAEPLDEKPLGEALRQWLKACEQQASPLDRWLSDWKKLAREQTAAWVLQMKEADQEKGQPNVAFGRWLNYLRDFLDPKLPTEKARQWLAQTLLIRQIWTDWSLPIPFPHDFHPIGLATALDTGHYALLPEWEAWREQGAVWWPLAETTDFLAAWLGEWPGLLPTHPFPPVAEVQLGAREIATAAADRWAAWQFGRQRGWEPYLFTRSLPDALLAAAIDSFDNKVFWADPATAREQFHLPQRALFQPSEAYFSAMKKCMAAPVSLLLGETEEGFLLRADSRVIAQPADDAHEVWQADAKAATWITDKRHRQPGQFPDPYWSESAVGWIEYGETGEKPKVLVGSQTLGAFEPLSGTLAGWKREIKARYLLLYQPIESKNALFLHSSADAPANTTAGAGLWVSPPNRPFVIGWSDEGGYPDGVVALPLAWVQPDGNLLPNVSEEAVAHIRETMRPNYDRKVQNLLKQQANSYLEQVEAMELLAKQLPVLQKFWQQLLEVNQVGFSEKVCAHAGEILEAFLQKIQQFLATARERKAMLEQLRAKCSALLDLLQQQEKEVENLARQWESFQAEEAVQWALKKLQSPDYQWKYADFFAKGEVVLVDEPKV